MVEDRRPTSVAARTPRGYLGRGYPLGHPLRCRENMGLEKSLDPNFLVALSLSSHAAPQQWVGYIVSAWGDT